MFTKLKPLLEPLLDFLTRPLLWVHPTIISIIAFIVPSLSAVALMNRENIFAAVLFLGNGLDAFDGYIARKTGKVTKFGGLLDTTLDRAVEAIVLLGTAMGGYVSFELAYTAMFFSVMVSFVKATATALIGEDNVGTNQLSVGIGQRGDRLFVLFIGMLAANYLIKGYNGLEIAIAVITVTSALTVIWRMAKAYSLFKKS